MCIRDSDKTGKSGDDIVIEVPQGTLILEEDNKEIIADIIHKDEKLRILKGGNGGFGNAHFKSSENQTPRNANNGESGEEKWIWLRLKLIADIGLVGLPNAGKSTLVSKVSQAKPKIADYPFTTLNPVLGIAKYKNHELVIADIPGLIEGAHQGKGLGHRFLGHIERCELLLHLIDANESNVIETWKIVRNEISAYSKNLNEKKEIIVLSKSDTIDDREMDKKVEILKKHTHKDVFKISSVTGSGINSILRILHDNIPKNSEDETQISWEP